MSKNINNTDLEQGRHSYTAVADGNAKTPPGGHVFGGFQCTTAGAVSAMTHAADVKNNSGSLVTVGTLVAGDWYPGRMTSFTGDGTLKGILYHETL